MGLGNPPGILSHFLFANPVCPRLGIRFVLEADTLAIYYPDGQRFLTTVELAQRAEQEKQRADSAEVEIARLKQLLQQAGVNADEVK